MDDEAVNDILEGALFLQDQVVALTSADHDTIENWVRYGYVDLTRRKGRRWYSPLGLVKVELIRILAHTFKVPPSVGSTIAAMALEEYRPKAIGDMLDVWSGTPFSAVSDGEAGRSTFELVRDGDELRPWQPMDPAENAVMIVLPTRLIARSIFSRMKILMEPAKVAQAEAAAKEAVHA